MRVHTALSAIFLTSTVLVGCARDSVGAIAAHQAGKGKAEIYDASFDDAWKAVHAVLRWDGAGTPEDHRDELYVVTNNPSSDRASFAEQVGVWFEPMGPTKTRVSVVVMTGELASAGVGGPDEQGVQKDIAKALSYVTSGQPLPEKRP